MAFKAQDENYTFSDSFTIRNVLLIKVLQFFVGLHGTTGLNLHNLGTGNIATALSRAMGDTRERQCQIALGGPLHDFGKIGVPIEILIKPGFLSPQERETMNTHAQYGFDRLRGLKLDKAFQLSPLTIEHHERLDGSGYPFGLSDISAPGRNIALADSMEAMIGARTYRKPMPLAEALIELKKDTFVKGKYGREEFIALEELAKTKQGFLPDYLRLNPTVYRSDRDHYEEYYTEVLTLILAELKHVIPLSRLAAVQESALHVRKRGHALARELGLGEEDLELLHITSVMSWLASLPYKVQDTNDNKDDQINKEIFRILELIGSSALFEEIEQVLVQSYYYYDDSYNEIIHYPKFKGNERIGFIAKIIQVIKGTDGLSPNDSIALLRKREGIKFDPMIAQAMIRVMQNSDYEKTTTIKSEAVEVREG
jgi:hypothetical protein